MKPFETLITESAREFISDLHIMSGMPLVYRKNGKLQVDNAMVWKQGDVIDLTNALLKPMDRKQFESRMSVDFARTINNVRIRINIFNSMGGYYSFI